jgi:hypothetical protein
MRLSGILFVGVVGMACGGSAETRQDPAPTPGHAGTSAPAPSPAPASSPSPAVACGDFGGKIHGVSMCESVQRASAAVTPMAERAGAPVESVACGAAPVTLDTMTVHLECVETATTTGKHAVVTLVIDDDTLNPKTKGQRLALDVHDGFWDFINTWIGVRAASVEITIDYGVLD